MPRKPEVPIKVKRPKPRRETARNQDEKPERGEAATRILHAAVEQFDENREREGVEVKQPKPRTQTGRDKPDRQSAKTRFMSGKREGCDASTPELVKILFWASAVCMLLTSSSFLLMPAASEKALDGERQWLILTGLLFWAPLIAGYALLFFANRLRKRRDTQPGEQPRGIRAWGAFRMASNTPALVADAAFLLSLIGLIVFSILMPENYGIYIFLCLSVFAFQMHCMLNGVNFKAVANRSLYVRKQEGTTNDTL
jgi:hypothetical protein